jgi:hypothetical protein
MRLKTLIQAEFDFGPLKDACFGEWLEFETEEGVWKAVGDTVPGTGFQAQFRATHYGLFAKCGPKRRSHSGEAQQDYSAACD